MPPVAAAQSRIAASCDPVSWYFVDELIQEHRDAVDKVGASHRDGRRPRRHFRAAAADQFVTMRRNEVIRPDGRHRVAAYPVSIKNHLFKQDTVTRCERIYGTAWSPEACNRAVRTSDRYVSLRLTDAATTRDVRRSGPPMDVFRTVASRPSGCTLGHKVYVVR